MTTTSLLCDDLQKRWVPLFNTRDAYFSSDLDKYNVQPWKEKAEAGEVSLTELQRSVKRVKSPYLNDAFPMLAPIVYQLMDDFEEQYRAIGVDIARHCVANVPTALWHHPEWAQPMYDTLLICSTFQSAEVGPPAWHALFAMHALLFDDQALRKQILGDFLKQSAPEDRLKMRLAYLDVLMSAVTLCKYEINEEAEAFIWLIVDYLKTPDINVLHETLEVLFYTFPYIWPSVPSYELELLSGFAAAIVFTERFRRGELIENRPTGDDITQEALDDVLRKNLARFFDVATAACDVDTAYYREKSTYFEHWLPSLTDAAGPKDKS